MKETAAPGYRLSRAKTSTKVLISLGMLGLLIGLTSAMALTVVRTGLTPSSVKTYYLGSASGEKAGDELEMLTGAQPRPVAELIEVTHFHLMGGSILLFLLCHLLSICEMRDGARTFFYVASFGSFLLTFTLPWAIIYSSPRFAYLFGPTITFCTLSIALLCLIPLKEMWFNSESRNGTGSRKRASKNG